MISLKLCQRATLQWSVLPVTSTSSRSDHIDTVLSPSRTPLPYKCTILTYLLTYLLSYLLTYLSVELHYSDIASGVRSLRNNSSDFMVYF